MRRNSFDLFEFIFVVASRFAGNSVSSRNDNFIELHNPVFLCCASSWLEWTPSLRFVCDSTGRVSKADWTSSCLRHFNSIRVSSERKGKVSHVRDSKARSRSHRRIKTSQWNERCIREDESTFRLLISVWIRERITKADCDDSDWFMRVESSIYSLLAAPDGAWDQIFALAITVSSITLCFASLLTSRKIFKYELSTRTISRYF